MVYNKVMKTVIAHGTFDIIHYGHINYLEKAKSYGDKLIVLVTSDKIAKEHHKTPYFDENTRLKMISSLKIVNKALLRNSSITIEELKKLKANVLVTTDGALAKRLKDKIEIIVLPRTPGISTSMIKKYLWEEER